MGGSEPVQKDQCSMDSGAEWLAQRADEGTHTRKSPAAQGAWIFILRAIKNHWTVSQKSDHQMCFFYRPLFRSRSVLTRQDTGWTRMTGKETENEPTDHVGHGAKKSAECVFRLFSGNLTVRYFLKIQGYDDMKNSGSLALH